MKQLCKGIQQVYTNMYAPFETLMTHAYVNLL